MKDCQRRRVFLHPDDEELEGRHHEPFLCLSVSSQKVSEKVGGAEGTKLDDDFKEMEKVLLFVFYLLYMSLIC